MGPMQGIFSKNAFGKDYRMEGIIMEETIFRRVSIRKYQDRPVEDEKMIMLLKAAMAAPSAGNQRPWEFYAINKPDILAKLSACSPYAGCAQNAPAAIVICYRKEIPMPDFALIDCAIAGENILLEAVDQQLGAVMLAVAPIKDRMDAVKQVLKMPDSLEPFMLIPVGYPAENPAPKQNWDSSRVHHV